MPSPLAPPPVTEAAERLVPEESSGRGMRQPAAPSEDAAAVEPSPPLAPARRHPLGLGY